MIEITLDTEDLSLDLPEIQEPIELDGSTGDLDLSGPQYMDLELEHNDWGLLDLDLLGFPYHGLSAYELAVQRGFNGSLDEWLASLKGEDGELGQAGQDGVARAEAAAASASGDALAAAGFRADAYAYSGVAGEYARSSNESYTQAKVMRDETGEIAEAMTYIRQQSEALLTDTTAVARATIEERVAAEVARAEAEVARDRTVQAESSASGSAASASDNAIMAVEARNLADDAAAATILNRDETRASADEAKIEAEAARTSQIAATAAKDDAQLVASGVIIDVDKAKAFADQSKAFSEVSRDERLLAEAANTASGQSAAASLQHSQTAKSEADKSGVSATASQQDRIKAETAQNKAEIARDQSVTAKDTAEGFKNQAKDQYDLTLYQAGLAGQSAAAALGYRNQAETFANTSGDVYRAVADSVFNLNARVNDVEGNVQTAMSASADAQGKVNTMYSLTLNSNGHITGWKFTNDGSVGSMVITTDKFSLVDPNGGNPRTPFQMDGNVLTLTGDVRVNGSLILNGTILGNAAVAKNTVMPLVSSYVAGMITIAGTVDTTVAEIYIDTHGDQVQVEFNGLMVMTHEPSGSFDMTVQLRRSGGGGSDLQVLSETVSGAGNTADNFIGKWPIKVLDRPGTGTTRYYVNVRTSASNMTRKDVFNRFMSAMELRTNS